MSEPTRPQKQKAVVAEKPRRKLLALKIVALVAVAVVVLAVLPALIATVYTPGCSGCHSMAPQVEAQKTGPHARVTCKSCHQGSTPASRFAFRQTVMYGMVLKVIPLSASQASVSDASCVNCHASSTIGTGSKGMVSAKGLQVAHAVCTKGQSCTKCHGGIGHLDKGQIPVSYTMNACISCHAERQIDSSKCASCHVGGSQNATRTGVASSFSVTHGPNWKQMHGTGDLSTCISCHAQSECARCHGPLVPHDRYIVKTHGIAAVKPGGAEKCATCHKDQKFCNDCHGIAMPHPSNFLQTHVTETQKTGEETCYNCHNKQDCDNCHAAHVHPGGAGL